MDRIKNELNKVIKKANSCNPFVIAEALKINVLYHILPENIKGYSSINRRMKTIVLNDSLNEHESQAVLCHELGHAVLHPGINTTFFDTVTSFSFTSKLEYQANCFMFLLLKENLDLEYDQISIYNYLKTIGLPESMDYYINRCW